MANQRIASALSHQADTTGFVPSAGYEEGNRSFSTDAIVVDIEASLDCLYGEDVDLDWEQMLVPVSLGEGILFNACDASEADISNPQTIVDTCACAQSTYWASVGGVDCSVLPTMYFYHPDYLGSVEFVTDMSGDPYQFFLNTIWGENLQNQLAFNTTAFSSRFRFNGKEWDEETGNFYYGARYYDPKISVWLSVDPLAAKFNNLSPYHFSVNNPINVFDHDGRDTTHANKQTQQRVNDAYHSTLKRIERLEKKIDKGMEDFLNGDMSDRKEGKYMDMLQEYRELSDIKRDFERIFDENTPCVKYEINDDKVGEGNSGLTVFKKGETITVYLSSGHPNSYYNQSVVIHENVHVNQIYSGVSHRSHNSELKAYQRQAIFEPGYVERFIQMQKSTGLWEAIQTSYWDYPVY